MKKKNYMSILAMCLLVVIVVLISFIGARLQYVETTKYGEYYTSPTTIEIRGEDGTLLYEHTGNFNVKIVE